MGRGVAGGRGGGGYNVPPGAWSGKNTQGQLWLSLLNSFLASSLNVFSGITSLIVDFLVLGFKTSTASTYFFLCFSKALPREEYIYLACSITLPWSEDSISSPVRYSYLPILPDDKAAFFKDFFAASMLISYCSF